MKKIILITLAVIGLGLITHAQEILKSSKGTVSFFSSAPLEDIFAESDKFSGAINRKTGKIAVFVKINTLKMENKRQQEHLNEKYLESDKYPKAVFSGEIVGVVDWDVNGKYDVKAKGTFDLHGVKKERTIPVTITVKGKEVFVHSKFTVSVADHNVEIPTLVFKKIAETVEITLNSTFIPYEKK